MLVRPGLSPLTQLRWAGSLSQKRPLWATCRLYLGPRGSTAFEDSRGTGAPGRPEGLRMVLVALLGLSWFCSPLGALVLDFNNIKSSTDVQDSGKGSQCTSDRDCSAGQFCFSPHDERLFCATCRRVRRRCQRSAVCCPGTICVNDVCTAVEDTRPVVDRNADGQDGTYAEGATKWPAEDRPQGKPSTKKSQSNKGQEGESCLRTSDCGPGLCCARHFWTKICKPVLREGQVCSRRGHKDTAQAPEIFQRCDCGPGLSCRSQVTGNRQHSRLRVCQRL